jgi:excisionase family DNA binding protein
MNNAISASDDAWLTTAEAAQHLRVSKPWLEKLRCVGGSPKYALLGRRVVYRRADLNAWAEARMRNSTSDQGKAA